MAAVKPCNVIQVVLAAPSRNDLATAERFFVRKLQPAFNIRDADENIVSLARSLSTFICDDVITFGNRILRRANPRLTPLQWASLIADVASAGDRVLASKLARQARETCCKARGLRALPQIIVPSAVPQPIFKNCFVAYCFARLERLPQYTIQLAVGWLLLGAGKGTFLREGAKTPPKFPVFIFFIDVKLFSTCFRHIFYFLTKFFKP